MISLIKDIHLLTLYKDISKEITCFDFETFCNSVDINKYKIKYDTAYQTLTHCLYDKNLSLEPLCISKTVDLFVRYIYVPDITDTRPGIYKQHIVSDNDTTNKYLLISILSDYVNNPYLIVFKYNIYHDTHLNKILTFGIYLDISKYTIKHTLQYFNHYYKFDVTNLNEITNENLELANLYKLDNHDKCIQYTDNKNNIVYNEIEIKTLNTLISIETYEYLNINTFIDIKSDEIHNLKYDTINNIITDKETYISVSYKGGIFIKNNFIDDISIFISLIDINKYKSHINKYISHINKYKANTFFCTIHNVYKIKIKATLIIVSCAINNILTTKTRINNIRNDITNINKQLKIICVFKTNDNITFNDIEDADIIIISSSYIDNFIKCGIAKINNIYDDESRNIYNLTMSEILQNIYFHRIIYSRDNINSYKKILNLNAEITKLNNVISYNKIWIVIALDMRDTSYDKISILLNNINYMHLINDIIVNNQLNNSKNYNIISKYCNNITIYKNYYINEIAKYIIINNTLTNQNIKNTIYNNIVFDRIPCVLSNIQLNLYNTLPEPEKLNFICNIYNYFANDIQKVIRDTFLYEYNIITDNIVIKEDILTKINNIETYYLFCNDLCNKDNENITINTINIINKNKISNIKALKYVSTILDTIYDNKYTDCCMICLGDISIDDYYVLKCGHVYCSTCLVDYIQIQIKNKNQIKCACASEVIINRDVVYTTNKNIYDNQIDKINKLKQYICLYNNSNIFIIIDENNSDIRYIEKYLIIERISYTIDWSKKKYNYNNLSVNDNRNIYILSNSFIETYEESIYCKRFGGKYQENNIIYYDIIGSTHDLFLNLYKICNPVYIKNVKTLYYDKVINEKLNHEHI